MSDNRLLDALTCRGVLASVSVRYWRARKQLRPSDLGLPDDKVNRRLISLGHKRLLPKERLAGLALIESRAHALLEANTFPFLNGIARYLPNERLAEVDAALADLQRQFEGEQREFLRSYGTYRAEALDEWRETAQGSARISHKPSAATPDLAASQDVGLVSDLDVSRHVGARRPAPAPRSVARYGLSQRSL